MRVVALNQLRYLERVSKCYGFANILAPTTHLGVIHAINRPVLPRRRFSITHTFNGTSSACREVIHFLEIAL